MVQAMGLAQHDTTILCTHHAPMAALNASIMASLYGRTCEPCPLTSNTKGHSDLHEWLAKPGFHDLTCVAEGCRVMLTSNRDIARGAVNGATGVVHKIERGAPSPCTHYEGQPSNIVTAVHVRLDHSNDIMRFSRTKCEFDYKHHGKKYVKSSFPLALAYAITGHKAQGATLTGTTVIHVTDVFCPGLMYVMLSRVQTRAQLRLLQPLTPDMFQPMMVPGMQ